MGSVTGGELLGLALLECSLEAVVVEHELVVLVLVVLPEAVIDLLGVALADLLDKCLAYKSSFTLSVSSFSLTIPS